MTRLQRILTGAYRDLEQWRSTPRLTPPGDRWRIAQHNRRCDLAERGAVPCDVSRWLGEPQTNGNRVSNCRIYKELACKNLAHPIAEGKRRQRTVALALTVDGEALARQLIAAPAPIDQSPVEASAPSGPVAPVTVAPVTVAPIDQSPVAASATPPAPIDQPPVAASATPPAPITTTGDDQLSRQSEFSRRKQSEVAEIGPLPEAVLTPRITNLDDALLYLAAEEPEEPPYTVAVNDELPVSRATIDELAAAGLLTIHEADGAVAVGVTIAGTLRTFAIENDRAASAKSNTASADTSSAAA